MPKAKGARAGGERESLRGPIARPRDTAPTLADQGIDKGSADHEGSSFDAGAARATWGVWAHIGVAFG